MHWVPLTMRKDPDAVSQRSHAMKRCVSHAAVALLLGLAFCDTAAAATPKKKKGSQSSPVEEEPYEPVNVEALASVEEFEEKVVFAVNSTIKAEFDPDGPARNYYPIVFFHVSWCEFCAAAMPEFDAAAGQIRELQKRGDVPGVPARFFSMRCDSQDLQVLGFCEKHIGNEWPSLFLWRDGKPLRFTRKQRKRQMYTWWVARHVRPLLRGIDDIGVLHSFQEPVFMLKASIESAQDQQLVEMWRNFSLDNLEYSTFALVDPKGPAVSAMDGYLTMWTPRDSGLKPVPFVGNVLDRSQVQDWISVNRFPELGMLTDSSTLSEYQKSNAKVVVLVHDGDASGKAAEDALIKVAAKVRQSAKYVFASMNASERRQSFLLGSKFRLVSPGLCDYPCIFGMHQTSYFEDPSLSKLDVSTAEEVLDSLFNSDEASQHPSWGGWFKERRKIYVRFALSSILNLVVAIAMPILGCALPYTAWQLLKVQIAEDVCEDEASQAAAEQGSKKKN